MKTVQTQHCKDLLDSLTLRSWRIRGVSWAVHYPLPSLLVKIQRCPLFLPLSASSSSLDLKIVFDQPWLLMAWPYLCSFWGFLCQIRTIKSDLWSWFDMTRILRINLISMDCIQRCSQVKSQTSVSHQNIVKRTGPKFRAVYSGFETDVVVLPNEFLSRKSGCWRCPGKLLRSWTLFDTSSSFCPFTQWQWGDVIPFTHR